LDQVPPDFKLAETHGQAFLVKDFNENVAKESE